MKKVMIMGCPGSDKSNLAYRLNKKTGLDLYHIKDDTISTNHTEDEKNTWISAVNEIAQKPEWIIEGTQSITFETRMKMADTVIFVDETPLRCVIGYIKERIRESIRKVPHRNHFRFRMIKKIMRYNKDFKPLINQLINQNIDHIEYIELRNENAVSQFLNDIGA
ncbi:MAG: hypothetical protein JXQ23_01040 [Clostridia bacterium]|nr:hypothetical protein [Clostridia bacterium]